MKTRDSGGRRGAVKGASLPLLSLFEFKCFSVCVCVFYIPIWTRGSIFLETGCLPFSQCMQLLCIHAANDSTILITVALGGLSTA